MAKAYRLDLLLQANSHTLPLQPEVPLQSEIKLAGVLGLFMQLEEDGRGLACRTSLMLKARHTGATSEGDGLSK